MKKTLLIVITALAALLTLTATAERKIWMYSHSGNHISMDVTDLDSISYEEPTVLELSEYSKKLDSKGGSFTLGITTNQAWKAEVNNPIAVTLSKTTSTGSDEIIVTAMENTGTESYSAIVTVTALNGMYKQLILTVAGTTPTPIDNVTDACNNTYPVVKIGEQYWMAENLRCDKYATQSEAYNASWLTNNTIPTTSESAAYTPNYTDASDKSKWTQDWYVGNLTDVQVKKLGYLYNWAAAVGVADGHDYGTKPFSGNRQGICPNGWHVPSRAEWQTLKDYIEKTEGKGTYTAGKHLKTTSGWYSGNSSYEPGLDTYGFAALPAGINERTEVSYHGVITVGGYTYFWTATSNENYSRSAYISCLDYDFDALGESDYFKYFGQSVRCLRNSESPTPTEILSITPTQKAVSHGGEQFIINVTSNASWEAKSDKNWVTLSKTSGSGDDTIDIITSENISTKADTAVVTFETENGKNATITIGRHANIPEKCKASDYPQVTIGTQVWMAENYRCSKYDTQSEAYKEGRYTVPTSDDCTYTPYHADASDVGLGVAGNLNEAQVKKLGYLYNWAAAVGVADGLHTSEFSGTRQGICPNGWHVPSSAEWQTLQDYIEKTDGKGTDTAGKHLKTTSGWYSGDSSYKPGLDTYGFAALPAGEAAGSGVAVGWTALFWTYTPFDNCCDDTTLNIRLSPYLDFLLNSSLEVKYRGGSVRCLKD